MAQIDKCKVPQAFWRAAEQFGIPPAALLRQARLPATLHLGGPINGNEELKLAFGSLNLGSIDAKVADGIGLRSIATRRLMPWR